MSFVDGRRTWNYKKGRIKLNFKHFITGQECHTYLPSMSTESLMMRRLDADEAAYDDYKYARRYAFEHSMMV